MEVLHTRLGEHTQESQSASFTQWHEALHVLLWRGMAATMAGHRPGTLACTCHAHVVSRAGSSAGRYYRSAAAGEKDCNFGEPWRSKVCSASKSSGVGHVSGKQARPMVQ